MTLTLTRRQMEERFGGAFEPGQVRVLAEVFDRIREAEIERAADTRDLKRGLAELAQAQRHTDETVARLSDSIDRLVVAQQRTDERLDKLVTAQQRTDERLDKLVTAQQRTDERL
ncbi:MAG: hypothetical protein GXP41_02220, partial [Chloroflexi bacterium]|nr:hypothetical protein [Chloroflexota bacterium]